MTTRAVPRRHLSLLYAGVVLTALVTLAPLVDVATVDTIADHVRDAYPDWSAGSVAADRDAIVGYLVAVGVFGIAGWLWTIRLVVRGSKRTRTLATTLFTLGALIALTNLTYGSGPYDKIVPTLYGVLGLLPVVIGAATLVQLWRHRPHSGSIVDEPTAGASRPIFHSVLNQAGRARGSARDRSVRS